MSDFSYMLSNYASILISVISVAMTILGYIAFRHKIDFLITDWWYRLPVIGGIARLSTTTDAGKVAGWRQSEETLCSDYKKHIQIMTQHTFNNALEYLKKARDGGRSPLSAWVIAFISLLVIAEGLGFSYLLGTWMARDGSANTHTLLMFAIVLVICGIMVWITHSAGHQLYRTNLINRARKDWPEAKEASEGSVGNMSFGAKPIALKDLQNKDDGDHPCVQCVNRVGDKGSYTWVILAVVVILGMAVTMTVMRWNHLQIELNNQTTASEPQSFSNLFSQDVNSSLPAEITGPQKAAEDKAKDEVKNSTEAEGLAAFLMLAFIFIVTQIVGISTGFRWGFAGIESKAAYKATQGFATYESYFEHYDVLVDIAEARLTRLQQEIVKKSNRNIQLNKTFRDFLVNN